MNKKAGAQSIVSIIAIVFIFAIFLFIVNFTAKLLSTSMMSVATINQTSPAAVTAFQGMEKSANRFDYMVFGIFIGSLLALVISSWFLGSEPIFVFIYMLVMVIAIPLAAVFANTWNDISNSSVFGNTVLSFPITNHLMTYLPFYTVGIGILGMVIIFIKPFTQKGL